jgi:hypothetical protein
MKLAPSTNDEMIIISDSDDAIVDDAIVDDGAPDSYLASAPEEDAINLAEYEKMTKIELDEYAAQEHGIYLDRRKTKIAMITDFIQKLKENN